MKEERGVMLEERLYNGCLPSHLRLRFFVGGVGARASVVIVVVTVVPLTTLVVTVLNTSVVFVVVYTLSLILCPVNVLRTVVVAVPTLVVGTVVT